MKSIYLLRHAKSDWEADYGEDHERPLASRGVKAAKRIGRLMGASGYLPDVILSSTAVRARTTVEIAEKAGEWGREIRLESSLYGADTQEIVRLARGISGDAESALFVGHEPGWSQAVSRLSGGGSVRMPTACLARIDLDVDAWSDVREGIGQLICLIPPKALD